MKVGDLVCVRRLNQGRALRRARVESCGEDGYGVIIKLHSPPPPGAFWMGGVYNVYWSKSSKITGYHSIDLEVISESR